MSFWKENRSTLVLMAITGLLLLYTGIVYEQSFFRILPLFISLLVALLQSRANRLAYLLGGLNCFFLYTAVHFYYTLYAQAVYVFFVSAPLQLMTFFRWRKRPYKSSTILKKMSARTRLIVFSACALAFLALYFILNLFGSAYMFLDNFLTLLGVVITLLTLYAYVEYAYLAVLNTFLNIILYAQMMHAFPEQITFLIFYVYSFICSVKAFLHVHRLYREQNAKKA